MWPNVRPRRRSLRRRAGDDSGAVAVLVALLMVVIMIMLGLVMDMGQVYVVRGNLQAAADAAALAAAKDLPVATGSCATQPTSTACVTAKSLAAANGVPNASVTVVAPYSGNDRSVAVSVSQRVDYGFGRIIGFTGRDVSARAVATKFGAGSGAYAMFSANEFRINGGGTGFDISGGPAYGGTTNFNGNEKNKFIHDPGGLQSPVTAVTTKWTDSSNIARTAPIGTTGKGTALEYATSIGLDGTVSGQPGVIPALGVLGASNWIQLAGSGNCTINQSVFDARQGYEVLYCPGTATVSGIPKGSTKMIKAASIAFGGDVGWNGSSCTSSILLYATPGGISNSGTDKDMCGTAYSPTGQFGTNGGGLHVHQGRVIADSILLSGNGGAYVDSTGDTILTASRVSLVE